jgi:hypothetical protein
VLNQLQAALGAPYAAEALAAWSLLSVVIFWPLARARRWSVSWTLLGLLALAPIIAFTIVPHAYDLQWAAIDRLRAYVGSFSDPWAAPGPEDERTANLALFVPAAFFLTLASRAPIRTALLGIAGPFLIEGWQAVADAGRVASAGDWLYNSGGAVAGVLAATLILPFTRRRRRPAATPTARRLPGPPYAPTPYGPPPPVPAAQPYPPPGPGWPTSSQPPTSYGPPDRREQPTKVATDRRWAPRWPGNPAPAHTSPTGATQRLPLETTLRLDDPNEITVDLR